MKTMLKMQQEYLALLTQNESRAARDFESARAYLKDAGMGSVKGGLCFQAAPKLFTREAYNALAAAAKTLYGILDKSIAAYATHASFRKLFDFSPALEELILTEPGYRCRLPVLRADLFLNEETLDFKFCEINADGASAMNEDREIGNALRLTETFRAYPYATRPFELFDSWVETFLEIYRDFLSGLPAGEQKNFNAVPVVGIVDFLDKATKREFLAFREAFRRRGVPCVIADIAALEYKKSGGAFGLFTPDGVKLDAVYRRAVTSDCMDAYESITAFLDAYRSRSACVIGAFRTQVIHSKTFFSVLCGGGAREFFTAEENAFIERHVPFTVPLERGGYFSAALREKDGWLIKPSDRYGSRGVAAGADYPQDEWRDILHRSAAQGFVLQAYCEPYKSLNGYFKDGRFVSGLYRNMTGLFLYAGRLAGLYSRQMLPRVTSEADEGRVAASWLAEDSLIKESR